MNKKKSKNKTNSFEKNWRERKESYYNHWTRGSVKNQIQLAFRNHWEIFNELISTSNFNKGHRVLEVGCGRGSLSCYFSDAGYKCTLLDYSESAINVAKKIFKNNKLKADFIVGDANSLLYKDKSFDIIFSIGLLEHFKNPEQSIREQVRVLDKGGLFIAYVVPKYIDNIQKDFEWINYILKGYVLVDGSSVNKKYNVFRSDDSSEKYIRIMEQCKLKKIQSSGAYPLPMISHSIDFPFTLMPEQSEKALVEFLIKMLEENKKKIGKHPWFCDEGYGQAFIVWGYK